MSGPSALQVGARRSRGLKIKNTEPPAATRALDGRSRPVLGLLQA
jgi:hypothetical protein